MAKSYEVQGTIYKIDQTQSYGSNNFQKREFIIILKGEGENPDYPNYLPMNFIKDKCSLLDNFQVGQDVSVTFNLGGRLWQPNDGRPEKAFADLSAWKIEALGQNVDSGSSEPQDLQFDEFPQVDVNSDTEVPF